MPNTLEVLQQIFRSILDQPGLVLTRESNSSNVKDWDSFAQIDLTMAIQDHYKIRFSLSDFPALKNVGDMVDLIERKIAAKES